MSGKTRTRGEVNLQICVGLICLIVIGYIIALNIIVGILVLIATIGTVLFYKKIRSKPFLNRLDSNKTINQEKFDNWYQKGIEKMKKGNSVSSIRYFKRALKSNPKDVPTLINIGILYSSKAMLNEARKYYSLASIYEPDNSIAKVNLEKATSSLIDAQQLYNGIRYNPAENVRHLKCLRCGSRDNLIAQLFQHTHREADGPLVGPAHKVTITTIIKSTIVPLCTECSRNLTKINLGRYVKFDNKQQPIVKFKGKGKWIPYIDWIAHIFYENDN